MSLRTLSRTVGRKLTTPGNRAPLDESYRQPPMDADHPLAGVTDHYRAASSRGWQPVVIVVVLVVICIGVTGVVAHQSAEAQGTVPPWVVARFRSQVHFPLVLPRLGRRYAYIGGSDCYVDCDTADFQFRSWAGGQIVVDEKSEPPSDAPTGRVMVGADQWLVLGPHAWYRRFPGGVYVKIVDVGMTLGLTPTSLRPVAASLSG